MSQAIQTYDLWRRDWIRLAVGFGLTGFGVFFCWVCFQDSDWRADERWIGYSLASMAYIPGILIISLRRLVMLDPICHQLRRVIFLLYIPIHRRCWGFSELRSVEARHESSGDDGYCCMVGVVPASGSIIWIRTFISPASGPSEEAVAFAKELALTTGLHYEIRQKNVA